MPRAANGISHNQPLGEGAPVMGTGCANREELGPSPREKDRLAGRMAQKRASFGNCVPRNPLGEIGSYQLLVGIAHEAKTLRARDESVNAPQWSYALTLLLPGRAV